MHKFFTILLLVLRVAVIQLRFLAL